MKSCIPILLLSLFVLCFISCENDEQEVQLIAGKKEVFPTIVGRGVDIDFRDSGLVRLRMKAGIMKRYEFNVPEPYYELDSGVTIFFYDKEGKEVSSLKARYGVYYEASRRAEVRYNVVVENQEGKRLETEKLKWRERDSIRNEGEVRMTENNRTLFGKKLIASEDFSHMEVQDYVFRIPVEELEKKKSE